MAVMACGRTASAREQSRPKACINSAAILAEQRHLPYEEAIERVMVDEWHMNVAMGRPGQPTEVGELVAFLLSQRSAYLTGALINIDGGTDF